MENPTTRTPLPAHAVWPWLAVAVVLTIKTAINPFAHSVFEIYHWAALGWWSDLPIYQANGVFDIFRYPPFFAVAFTPLALLGPKLGGIAWIWLSLAVYATGCLRFLREVLPESWTARRETLFSLLCLLGAIAGLWNSQANAFICGMTLLGVADLMRDRPWRAAFWLGGAILIKVTPVAIVGLLCLVRLRTLVPRLMLVVVLGLVLPLVTRPVVGATAQYSAWLDQLRLNGQSRWPGYRDAWTLYQGGRWLATGASIDLVEVVNPATYRVVQFVTAGLTVGWVLALRWRGASRRDLLLAALATGGSWLLLFGPSVEHSTVVVLVPALVGSLLLLAQPVRFGGGVLAFALISMVVVPANGVANALRPVVPLIDCAMPFGVSVYVFWLALWSRGPGTEVRTIRVERSPRVAA